MKILNILEDNINDRYIDMVVDTLEKGGIIILCHRVRRAE